MRLSRTWLPMVMGMLTSAQAHAGDMPLPFPIHVMPPPPAPSCGNAINGLTQTQAGMFSAGKDRFTEVDSVNGNAPGATGAGLGPVFNLDSCAGCHAYPALGGSTPPINPAFAAANRYGANNKMPSFETVNGPLRVVRFRYATDGTRDGGVHDLFTIAGRHDAPACTLAQPDFVTEQALGNLSFRIPTPVFGAGLIEAIDDTTILANKSANGVLKAKWGILGHENRNGNTGTITRFGWKAQNATLDIFAGEAYAVEMGVTNNVFSAEHGGDGACSYTQAPEDDFTPTAKSFLDGLDDVTSFANFMRMLAPPPPAAPTTQTSHGAAVFTQVGCNLCHTPSLTTGSSKIAALSYQPAGLYSDLLVHHMGPGLADQIVQGNAGPDEFRSAPLWGVGARLFYLHDGRTNDLRQAILAHASSTSGCQGAFTDDGVACQSEANAVVANFSALSSSDQSALLAFLKSL